MEIDIIAEMCAAEMCAAGDEDVINVITIGLKKAAADATRAERERCVAVLQNKLNSVSDNDNHGDHPSWTTPFENEMLDTYAVSLLNRLIHQLQHPNSEAKK